MGNWSTRWSNILEGLTILHSTRFSNSETNSELGYIVEGNVYPSRVVNDSWQTSFIYLKKLQLCTQEHSYSRLKTPSAAGSVALQCWIHTIVPISNLILEQQQCFTTLQSAIITISLWITMSFSCISLIFLYVKQLITNDINNALITFPCSFN